MAAFYTSWRMVLIYSLLIGSLVTCVHASDRRGLIWSADQETGDLSQWIRMQGEAVFNTGAGEVHITDAVAHSGRYALELTIRDADGRPQAARIFRWYEDPQEAYYSAWFLFPQVFTPALWWNVFQFKSPDSHGESQPVWVLNVGNLDDGEMFFYLWDALNARTYDVQLLPEKVIPVGRWVHIEAFYRKATDGSGRITIWQDGTMIFDLDGVQTAISDEVQWSLNNYTDRIIPSTATIYVDDAAISKTRLGEDPY